MPGTPKVLVIDNTTGSPISVPAAEYANGIKSGKWRPYDQTVLRTAGPDGEVANRDAGEYAGLQATGADFEGGADSAIRANQARTEAAFDNLDDKALTFAEGITDALSFGLVRERGDEADTRREVDSGSALAGELAGTVLGLKLPGPMSWLAEGGGAAGKMVAQAAGAGDLVSHGLAEAGTGAALMGAGSVGHQLFDALLDNKDFSAQSVIKDAGLGTLLGFGGGIFSGGLASLRTAESAVEAQGGLFDPKSVDSMSAAGHVQDAVSEMNRAVATHEARLGVLSGLSDQGIPLDEDAMAIRRDALAKAQAARDAIGNVGRRMAKLDPTLSSDLDGYQIALRELDRSMRPGNAEVISADTNSLLENLVPPDVQNPGAADVPFNPGARDLDASLFHLTAPEVTPGYLDPALRGELSPQVPPSARYLNGYYQAPPVAAELADTVPEVARGPEEGFAGPQEQTSAGKRRAVTPEAPVPQEAAEGRFSEVTRAQAGAKIIAPSEAAQAGGNVLSQGAEGLAKTQALYQDGYFGPASHVADNAEAFSRFTDHMAEDTEVRRARKAESFARAKSMGPEKYGPAEKYGPFEEYGATEAPKTVVEGRGQNAAKLNAALDKAEPGTVVEQVNSAKLNSAADRAKAQAAKALGSAKTEVGPNPLPPGPEGQSTLVSPAPEFGDEHTRVDTKSPLRHYLDQWAAEAEKMGPVASPGDIAAARIHQKMQTLYQMTGGRADAVAALELGEKYGFPTPETPLGERVQQVMLLRKMAEEAGDIAAAGKGLARGKDRATWMKRHIFGRAGKTILGAVVGGKIGGEAGYLLGAGLAGGYAETAGKMAAAAGRTMLRVMEAADTLVRARVPLATAAAIRNRAYAYSPAGPIQDPTERILEIQRVAGNEQALRATARAQMGDLTAVHPVLAQALEDQTVRTMQALSARAPAVMFDRLGRPISPPSSVLRAFLEYENAIHNADDAIAQIGRGTASRNVVDAARDAVPAVYAALVGQVMANREGLEKVPQARLRQIEAMTGLPLTSASDPAAVARSQMAWAKAGAQAQGQGGGQPSPNVNGLHLTGQGMATPDSSQANGRAPGN